MDALDRSEVRQEVAIQLERWAQFWPDAKPLMAAHKIETGQDDSRRPLVPAQQQISRIEQAGALLLLGARSGLVLVGYSIWYIIPSLETDGLWVGAQGPWYVLPEWRRQGVALRLWREALVELRKREVRLLLAHAPTEGAGAEIGRFFERQGGRAVETQYEIWLED